MPAAAGAIDTPEPADGAIRFAAYNVALEDRAGGLIAHLEAGLPKARLSAEIIQAVRPDVLLLLELDRDPAGRSLSLYADNYVAVGQNGRDGIDYPHRVHLPSNTGVPTGLDLDGADGIGASGIEYARDAKGFGWHEGHYAFVLLSRHPVVSVRTFTQLLWDDMPGARLQKATPKAVRAVLPLSSKTHAIITLDVDGTPIHVIAAHPTPPIGHPRNIPRNADEIRMAVDLTHAARSQYAVDDAGVRGGLAPGAHFVVMGDLNADPQKGRSAAGAIDYLLSDPLVNRTDPGSVLGKNDTAEFESGMRLRVDYVIPSKGLLPGASGVVWPAAGDPLENASDHRMVWVDVTIHPE